MKKIFFLLTMLASITASAQNMQIMPLGATYTASPVIKFKVGWTGARTYRHNTKVWVFVDYRKVENNAPTGSWARAAVTVTPAVLSTPTSTTATLIAGNDKGFWLHGTDGDYSATLTVTLSGVPAQFNWCAYATDYPPNVVTHGNSSYTLRGSRPFVVNGSTLTANQTTFSGTITSFTDATGAPGLYPAALGEKANEWGCVAGLVENMQGVCVTPTDIGCVGNTLDLGTVSFTAGTEVEIIGNGVSQIWSRAVTATGCKKSTANVGVATAPRADCLANTVYDGDMFNACAAMQYAEQLCPHPWRVPSYTDFANLIVALGGELNMPADIAFINDKLVDIWGLQWIGVMEGNSCCVHVGTRANYRGITMNSTTIPENNERPTSSTLTAVNAQGSGNPLHGPGGSYCVTASSLNYGNQIRCVK